jgi:hypothetical protein
MHFLITDTLSPAAQAILDAYMKGYGWLDGPCDKDGLGVAAVLRAAADQVAPWQEEPTEDSVGPTVDFGYAWALFSKGVDIRQALTAIADELEERP